MTNGESFNELIRANAAAPSDETEEYRRFNNQFSMITMNFMIACAYLASFILYDEVAASKILSYFPLLNERSSFLLDRDISSYMSFAATVGSIFVTAPLTIAIFARGYWITVVVPRKCRRVSPATFLSMAFSFLVSSILVAIAFIHVPTTYDPRWPGMAFILFWPVFPA
ncbi:MAG: hypothetical protein R3D34_04675, partial [Nitratireductor sp.]